VWVQVQGKLICVHIWWTERLDRRRVGQGRQGTSLLDPFMVEDILRECLVLLAFNSVQNLFDLNWRVQASFIRPFPPRETRNSDAGSVFIGKIKYTENLVYFGLILGVNWACNTTHRLQRAMVGFISMPIEFTAGSLEWFEILIVRDGLNVG